MNTQEPFPIREYKIDDYTKVIKFSNGVEIVDEDYRLEYWNTDLVLPHRVFRAWHPGGREDCKLVMSGPLRVKPKKQHDLPKPKKPDPPKALVDQFGREIGKKHFDVKILRSK